MGLEFDAMDLIVRVAMTHRMFDDDLSPMQALAVVLRDDVGKKSAETAEIMSRMTGREVTTSAVTKYLATGRAKLREAGQVQRKD